MGPGSRADGEDVLVVDLSADDPHAVDAGAWDLDAPDGTDRADGADGAGPADDAAGSGRSRPGPPRRARWTWAVVLAGAAAVVVVLTGASSLLRSPQERLQDRLTDALDAAGVRLAEPVSLEDDGAGQVWTGLLRVREAGGGVTGVRVALRPDPPESAEPGVTAGLFPLVDCGTRYPLSWAGDSDTSFRTTRADLAECVTSSPGGGVLATIAWRSDDDSDDGSGDGSGAAGRQTWRTDLRGGVVWLHNGSNDSGDGSPGLTGEQQRAVATTEGLLAPL